MWGGRRSRNRGCLSLSFRSPMFFVFLFFSFLFLSFVFPFVLFFFPTLASRIELLETRRCPPKGARTETKRQKRKTSQHCKRRNWGDEDVIRAKSPKNVNNRTPLVYQTTTSLGLAQVQLRSPKVVVATGAAARVLKNGITFLPKIK